MDTADLNYAWAWALFEGLIAGGVQRVVISPGSRSTPLALAATRHPELTSQVILDERAAAFFALGGSKSDGSPTALVATSGTAVSEWLPAVAEADLSRVPLVLLSADRPPELRQCGANQTIDQGDLFGAKVRNRIELPLPDAALLQVACRYAAQSVAAARWPLPGAVHLNVSLREPLTPSSSAVQPDLVRPTISRPRLVADRVHLASIAAAIDGQPGLIICGPECGGPLPVEAIARLGAALRVPILADPLSNLRSGTHGKGNIISHYDTCLRQPAFRRAAEPAWVLRFGALPVSKELAVFLVGLGSSRQILVDPSGRWPDPLHRTTDLVQADPEDVATSLAEAVTGVSDDRYLAVWTKREATVREILVDVAPEEARIVETLREQLPAGSRLFCGNSLPIRQLDWFFEHRDPPLRILCNRGASGIDGNVATLLGIGSTGEGALVGLLGDLTLVHDIGALAEAGGCPAVVVVLDNGGGAIFDHLPQHRLEEHEALFTTPRPVNLEAAAKAFGLGYWRAVPAEFTVQFAAALAEAARSQRLQIMQLVLDRGTSLERHRALWAALAR